ncbi:hypothetical protein J6590_066965 [Homalodisca vitripennis]|nr:hypothetical protein J6590_066965 [Homalodisca vitripennis]
MISDYRIKLEYLRESRMPIDGRVVSIRGITGSGGVGGSIKRWAGVDPWRLNACYPCWRDRRAAPRTFNCRVGYIGPLTTLPYFLDS